MEDLSGQTIAIFASPLHWLLLTVATILLTVFAGLPPAIYAMNEDPAAILQKDF
jgi:ABC-type lipoprotein release transport system permease subunit